MRAVSSIFIRGFGAMVIERVSISPALGSDARRIIDDGCSRTYRNRSRRCSSQRPDKLPTTDPFLFFRWDKILRIDRYFFLALLLCDPGYEPRTVNTAVLCLKKIPLVRMICSVGEITGLG